MGFAKKGAIEGRYDRREQAREEQTSQDVCKYFPSDRKPKRNKPKYFKGR